MIIHFKASVVANLLAVFTAIVAAWYWYKSSQVPTPTELIGGALIGGRVHVNTNPLIKASKESGRLNAIAASWSAMTALLVAVATLCDAIDCP